MPLLSLGISFRRASVELLERLAFTDDDYAKAYRRAHDLDGIQGAVILSTCNRVEVYGMVAGYHEGFLALKRLLLETRGAAPEEIADPLYSHWEQQAADHLFAVAAGLDSMVLGETQIHAQVRDALRRAEAEDASGPTLSALFHAASRAGRRVRRETSLGAAPDAFVSMGADMASETLGGLSGRQVVVVGAGQIASLAVKHLRDRGVGPVRILNRSLERARTLAERIGAGHGDLEELPGLLAGADLVVSATGAAGHVVRAEDVLRATAGRAGRPLVLLDLAVPRDAEPSCAGVPGVTLFDIVSLRERADLAAPQAAGDIARAHEIVGEEVRRWDVRRHSDALAPLIRALHARGDDAVSAELERWSSRLTSLAPDEREAVVALARGVVAKLLHDPIVALKERTGADAASHARLLAEIFGIDPGDPA